jgi:hypothetical protein
MRLRVVGRTAALLAVLLAPGAVRGEEVPPPKPPAPREVVEEIEVVGHYQSQSGRSESASAGTITRQLVEDRPILRPGEVLELVPGLIITQHSGAGKANQYYLRGFNLDHGTDFATTLDGVPLNLRTHAHGQGYTDLNLGRKNFLFVGSDEAGENLAGLYSLIATCEANEVNPVAYLADVLIRVQTHPASRIDELLPNRWAPALPAPP